MKRLFSLIFVLLLVLCPSLSSCATNTFVLVYYETYEHMASELPFTMETVPGEEDVAVYGAMDKSLGQIKYSVLNEGERMNGTLVLRMSTLSYAEKYTTDKTPGIAGIESGAAVKTEKLGVYDVEYYISGSTVFAVWNEAEYAYSIAFTFTDAEAEPTAEDIRPYVIALISTTK